MEVAEVKDDQERMRHRRAVVTWPWKTPADPDSPEDSVTTF